MLVEESRFDYDMLASVPILTTRKKKGRKYLDIVCAFDIETTRLKEIEQSVMYIWQAQIGEDWTVVGRYWSEFISFIDKITERIKDVAYLVFYVHNLSFEMSFLKGVYPFKEDEVFCTESRKVLRCDMNGCIEFRCSYFLTNMSLDRFLKKYDVENRKLSGEEFDYSKIRYPWSPLTAREMEYCINDVKGLVQALTKQMHHDGDDLQTIPLTSTGYVRRDVKKAMQGYHHIKLHNMLPDVEVYKLLREAFRGGDTLSNRWNTDDVVENVRSVDIVSSYPSSMLMNLYPMERFYQMNTSDFNRLYLTHSHALLFRIAFYDLDVRNIAEGHLYLSRDKCRNITGGTFVNGRILCADFLETTITDIDYEIISRRYRWSKMVIECLYASRYHKLPIMFRNVILNYYRVKTELKGCEEGSDEYYFYMRNKEKLNSAYGMCCEDIGKDEIRFIDGDYVVTDTPLSKLIAKNNAKAFLNYAWGVWTTCHSRKRLADGIDVVTHNGREPMNFVYSDTDSIKYIGDVDFTDFNRRLEEEAKECGAYASDKWGEVHFMGVFEDEGYIPPNRFKTLGAKKYVYEDSKGRLHITIAGVDKRKGADELGSLDNFREGFIFRKAGGTESIFNDHVNMIINVDGHDLRITDNVVIRDSTYTLGITAEYRAILQGLVDIKYSDVDIPGLFKVKT